MTLIDCLDLKARIETETDPAKKAALEQEYSGECVIYGDVPGLPQAVSTGGPDA